jgi:hypothetical protein
MGAQEYAGSRPRLSVVCAIRKLGAAVLPRFIDSVIPSCFRSICSGSIRAGYALSVWRISVTCRKVWDLYCVTACPLHRRMLFDRCPNCAATIKGMRRSLPRCRCGCDWRSVKTLQLEDREFEIARRVYDLCGLPCRSALNLCEGDNPLLRLNLNQFAVLLLSLAGHIDYMTNEHVSPSILAKLSLTVGDLHGALERAFNGFQDWPRGLHEFLDWASPRATGYRRWTPAQRLDRLYNCLINFSEELGGNVMKTIDEWQSRDRANRDSVWPPA